MPARCLPLFEISDLEGGLLSESVHGLAFPVCADRAPEFLNAPASFRIISIGGILVCSACGYENQVGNRFCGMCGTPLPHRPLTIPGAQGTHSFMRVPLEGATPPERQPVTTPPEETGAPAAPSRTGVLLEMPSPESRSTQTTQSENSVPPAADTIPEVPLDEYVKSFHYVPPTDPREITMRGDAPVLQSETASTDASATAPAGDTTFASADDIRERLGLEDAPQEERHDRPRFLDFSETPAPPEKPTERESNIVSPSFLGLSDAPRVAAEPAGKTETGKPARASWGIWLAVAVLLVFGVLGVLEWLSRVNQTNDGPLEVITMKIREITHRNSQAPQSAAETSPSTPERQAEVQPKPQAQDQNAAASPTEKPKAKPRAAQEGDEEVPVEKSVPGEEEMAKANNASDSAAAAAWLWKATAKGNPDAPVRLAGMYIKGNGVPRNCEQAL